MKESQQLFECIDRLNKNLERLISRLEALTEIPRTALDEAYIEAETLRKAKAENTTKVRNKIRVKSEIEAQGAVPFVVKCFTENMTYEKTAESAKQAGFQFSRQTVSRFYRSISSSKVENGKIYMVLKNGDTYVINADTFEVISMAGKF